MCAHVSAPTAQRRRAPAVVEGRDCRQHHHRPARERVRAAARLDVRRAGQAQCGRGRSSGAQAHVMTPTLGELPFGRAAGRQPVELQVVGPAVGGGALQAHVRRLWRLWERVVRRGRGADEKVGWRVRAARTAATLLRMWAQALVRWSRTAASPLNWL